MAWDSTAKAYHCDRLNDLTDSVGAILRHRTRGDRCWGETGNVLTLLPPGGWRAVLTGEDGTAIYRDLIGWGVVQFCDRNAVQGLVPSDIGVISAETYTNFAGYAAPGEEWSDECEGEFLVSQERQ